MRVAILGGTQFIGRAILEDLVQRQHSVLVIHRGESEPADLPPVEHLHVDRKELATRKQDIAAFAADVFLDTNAMSTGDVTLALQVIPKDARTVVLSSSDVYRAYEGLHQGIAIEPVPLTEESALRVIRYPYRVVEVFLSLRPRSRRPYGGFASLHFYAQKDQVTRALRGAAESPFTNPL